MSLLLIPNTSKCSSNSRRKNYRIRKNVNSGINYRNVTSVDDKSSNDLTDNPTYVSNSVSHTSMTNCGNCFSHKSSNVNLTDSPSCVSNYSSNSVSHSSVAKCDYFSPHSCFTSPIFGTSSVSSCPMCLNSCPMCLNCRSPDQSPYFASSEPSCVHTTCRTAQSPSFASSEGCEASCTQTTCKTALTGLYFRRRAFSWAQAHGLYNISYLSRYKSRYERSPNQWDDSLYFKMSSKDYQRIGLSVPCLGRVLLVVLLMATLPLTLAMSPPPNYSRATMPTTSFTCADKATGGYYADPEAECQMFHVCVRISDDEMNDFRFLCPNDTVFDQQNFICTNWWEIDCERSTRYYSKNDLFRVAEDQPAEYEYENQDSPVYYEYVYEYVDPDGMPKDQPQGSQGSQMPQSQGSQGSQMPQSQGSQGSQMPQSQRSQKPQSQRSQMPQSQRSQMPQSQESQGSQKPQVSDAVGGEHRLDLRKPQSGDLSGRSAETTFLRTTPRSTTPLLTTTRSTTTTIPPTSLPVTLTTKRLSHFETSRRVSSRRTASVSRVLHPEATSLTPRPTEATTSRSSHRLAFKSVSAFVRPTTTPTPTLRERKRLTARGQTVSPTSPLLETKMPAARGEPVSPTSPLLERERLTARGETVPVNGIQIEETPEGELTNKNLNLDAEDPYANYDWKKDSAVVTAANAARTRYEALFGATSSRGRNIVPKRMRESNQQPLPKTTTVPTTTSTSLPSTANKRKIPESQIQRGGPKLSEAKHKEFSNFRFYKTAFGRSYSSDDLLGETGTNATPIRVSDPVRLERTASRNTRYSIYG